MGLYKREQLISPRRTRRTEQILTENDQFLFLLWYVDDDNGATPPSSIIRSAFPSPRHGRRPMITIRHARILSTKMVRLTLYLRFFPLHSGLEVLPRTKHPSGEPQQASLALLGNKRCAREESLDEVCRPCQSERGSWNRRQTDSYVYLIVASPWSRRQCYHCSMYHSLCQRRV